jgi:cell division protein FtsB
MEWFKAPNCLYNSEAFDKKQVLESQYDQLMSTPIKRPSTPRTQVSSMQIVFGSILAISLLLAINFSGRIAAGRRIEADRDSLLRNISTLQARATALRSELDYVDSDAFVEKWARKEGRMVKGDEVLVVPVPGRATPMPAARNPELEAVVATVFRLPAAVRRQLTLLLPAFTLRVTLCPTISRIGYR